MMLHDELARMGASFMLRMNPVAKIFTAIWVHLWWNTGGRSNSDCAGKGISDTNLPGGFGYTDKTSLDDSFRA